MATTTLKPARLLRVLLDHLEEAVLLRLPNGLLQPMNVAAEQWIRHSAGGADACERLDSLAEALRLPHEERHWIDPTGREFSITTLAPSPGDTQPLVVVVREVRAVDALAKNHAEFIHTVSHDLRSPLTTMTVLADALETGAMGELQPPQLEAVRKLSGSLHYMARLVENIQDAGRYDPVTGLYQMALEPVDLVDLIGRLVEELVIPPGKAALRVHTALAADVPIIRGDERMLEGAIINLLDNAVKYTPDGGTITVALEATPWAVTVSVRDDGPGIPAADQRRVFERHVRLAREETRRVRGSGLGLFIVRSVAERHGGSIELDSMLGEGSTFRLILPLNGPTVEADVNPD